MKTVDIDRNATLSSSFPLFPLPRRSPRVNSSADPSGSLRVASRRRQGNDHVEKRKLNRRRINSEQRLMFCTCGCVAMSRWTQWPRRFAARQDKYHGGRFFLASAWSRLGILERNRSIVGRDRGGGSKASGNVSLIEPRSYKVAPRFVASRGLAASGFRSADNRFPCKPADVTVPACDFKDTEGRARQVRIVLGSGIVNTRLFFRYR